MGHPGYQPRSSIWLLLIPRSRCPSTSSGMARFVFYSAVDWGQSNECEPWCPHGRALPIRCVAVRGGIDLHQREVGFAAVILPGPHFEVTRISHPTWTRGPDHRGDV